MLTPCKERGEHCGDGDKGARAHASHTLAMDKAGLRVHLRLDSRCMTIAATDAPSAVMVVASRDSTTST